MSKWNSSIWLFFVIAYVRGGAAHLNACQHDCRGHVRFCAQSAIFFAILPRTEFVAEVTYIVPQNKLGNKVYIICDRMLANEPSHSNLLSIAQDTVIWIASLISRAQTVCGRLWALRGLCWLTRHRDNRAHNMPWLKLSSLIGHTSHTLAHNPHNHCWIPNCTWMRARNLRLTTRARAHHTRTLVHTFYRQPPCV